MMNGRFRICAPFLGACLALPIATALPPSAAPAQDASTRVAARTQDAQPQVCFTDVFSGPLPGRADYCQGMQDWDIGHYQDGLQFLKLAAGWGNKDAQYTLGLIHYGGRHVPTNVALGLAWLKLADERHNDSQINAVRYSAFKSATPAQRERAQDFYRKLQGQYRDKVAAARAWHHLQHWRRHNRFNSGCIRVYGPEAAAAKRLGLAGMPPATIGSFLHPSKPIASNGSPKSRRRAHRLRNRFSSARADVCVTLNMQHHLAQKLALTYFAGTPWMGSVTVGPLQLVPTPATSSGH